jgi:hypothetical protein
MMNNCKALQEGVSGQSENLKIAIEFSWESENKLEMHCRFVQIDCRLTQPPGHSVKEKRPAPLKAHELSLIAARANIASKSPKASRSRQISKSMRELRCSQAASDYPNEPIEEEKYLNRSYGC